MLSLPSNTRIRLSTTQHILHDGSSNQDAYSGPAFDMFLGPLALDIDEALSMRVVAVTALTRRVSEAASNCGRRSDQTRRRVREVYPRAGHRDDLAYASG